MKTKMRQEIRAAMIRMRANWLVFRRWLKRSNMVMIDESFSPIDYWVKAYSLR
jgi:hypothetical protein